MRVTQSMLSSNMLRNLNTSYGKMGNLQNQLNSGSKINRPSDDPVIAVKGMGYRTNLAKVEQYQRNLGEANTWLDTTDTTLGQVGDALHRVKELLVQASNDTNLSEDREKMASELKQMREQMRDFANTKVGDDYIFSGTHTDQPLYKDGEAGQNALVSTGKNSDFKINVFDGVSINVNTPGSELFGEIDGFMDKVVTVLEDPASTGADIGELLGTGTTTPMLDTLTNNALTKRADIGARQNRVEMMTNRLDIQFINVTKQMSVNEDTDYAATITEMVTQESIHQASLSVGAKIIQQTLVDFMR